MTKPRLLTTQRNEDDPPRLRAVAVLDRELADWVPLIELVGEELATWFAWLGTTRLEDGAELHSYRHTATLTELQVARDGRAFSLDRDAAPTGSAVAYTQIPRARAITQAVAGWGRSPGYEPGKQGPLIDGAVARAVVGARFWVDPAFVRELLDRDETQLASRLGEPGAASHDGGIPRAA